MDKKIRVKFNGGREGMFEIYFFIKLFTIFFFFFFKKKFIHIIVIGSLKGYDPLLNLVLDDTEEFLRGKELSNLIFSFFYLYILLIIIIKL